VSPEPESACINDTIPTEATPNMSLQEGYLQTDLNPSARNRKGKAPISPHFTVVNFNFVLTFSPDREV